MLECLFICTRSHKVCPLRNSMEGASVGNAVLIGQSENQPFFTGEGQGLRRYRIGHVVIVLACRGSLKSSIKMRCDITVTWSGASVILTNTTAVQNTKRQSGFYLLVSPGQPRHQCLQISRFNRCAAPDAEPGGCIFVRPDVVGHFLGIKQRNHLFNLVCAGL